MSGQPEGRSSFKGISIVIAVTVAATLATVWLVNTYLFPTAFRPVELSQKERTVLDTKIGNLKIELRTTPAEKKKPAEVLKPQPYSEKGASREVIFTEREMNALIATNTDLAGKVAIDLSPDLVSASILIPLDPEMPVFGGKTLRIAAGLDLHYEAGRPVVILRGVSLWGVPIPNSWLGNLKNVDLVHEFGDEGFWKAFAAGVDYIAVTDGKLTIKLKE